MKVLLKFSVMVLISSMWVAALITSGDNFIIATLLILIFLGLVTLIYITTELYKNILPS